MVKGSENDGKTPSVPGETSSYIKNAGGIDPPPSYEEVAPSAPPITDLSSQPSITPSEKNTLITTLREAKLAIQRSNSINGGAQGLAMALEKIYNVADAAGSRLSENQADGINGEIRKIMTVRSEVKRKRMEIRRTTYDTSTTSKDFVDVFVGIMMGIRMFSDSLCIILLILFLATRNMFPSASLVTLAIPMTGFFFTYLICIKYCYNEFRKLKVNSNIGRFETCFCVVWIFLYGYLATWVLYSPKPMLGPVICGYISMVTCIAQRLMNCKDQEIPNESNRKNSDTSGDIMMLDIGNDINLDSTNQNDDPQVRIAAIENLKTTIQSFLTELLGPNYMYRKRLASTENRAYNTFNN